MLLFKGHGLGNDYLAVEPRTLSFDLTPPAIRLLCDRHLGFGSDGILARVDSAGADFGLRIFNPDGSEAEKSGNGLRIFAAYLLAREAVSVGAPFTVETPGGLVTLHILERTSEGVQVEVDMGTASFLSSAVGLRGEEREVVSEPLELPSGRSVLINTVSLGNPHCVVFQDRLDPEELRLIAPSICTHAAFARGTNVQFARVAGPTLLEAWIWERGAGETLASGSSACAVASAAIRRGLVSAREVEVRMAGGTLAVAVREDWTVMQRGPAEAVFNGEPLPDLVRRLEGLR